MQLLSRGAVIGNGVVRQVFGEICLDDGDAHLQQLAVFLLEPLDGVGVREIDSRARLGESMHQGQTPTRLALHQEAATLALGAHL